MNIWFRDVAADYSAGVSWPKKIRVLVVDDSVVIRRLITKILDEDGELEVVGVARNGIAALEKIEQLAPDVVTLDIEMPEMDGLEALRQIRPRFPDVKVIMFSTHTDRGASATVNALMLGASDYVTKPSNEGRIEETLAALRAHLVPKIKSLCAARQLRHLAQAALRSGTNVFERASSRMAPEAVVMGVSTGGPAALAAILPSFPVDFPLPIYIVQHMPAVFTRMLANRLDAQCRIKVLEASEEMAAHPGSAIVAAGNYHMKVVRRAERVLVTLDQGVPVNSCRPAVDVLFNSAHEVYGGNVIATILTGMGQDGLCGSELLKGKGGYVIAQDQPSSVVWGMPGAVVNAGVADIVLPLGEIVPEILRLMRAA